MNVPFRKMHGAGNDFILVDNRDGNFPSHDAVWMRDICRRRTGVGSDGIILLESSHRADFRMRFFNPDGVEVEMCGNGARCVARLASDLGITAGSMCMETVAGNVSADVLPGDRVRIGLTDPTGWVLAAELALGDRSLTYGMVNTGVPHVVIRVDDVEAVDVDTLGSAIRRHPRFAPDGTNVNFLQVSAGGDHRIRTFERGVEAETLACGTGVAAAALLLSRQDAVHSPVSIRVAGGAILSIAFEELNGALCNVRLEGPVACVYEGTLEYAE